jgi:5-methylcytosine-specific restriction endonuclease McrA
MKKVKERTRRDVIKDLDAKVAKIIKDQQDYTCIRCHTKRKSNQLSHFWGRRNLSTRFTIENLDCLCAGCHMLWEGNKQGAYRDYMIKKLGQDGYDELEIKARSIVKWSMVELELLLKSMK